MNSWSMKIGILGFQGDREEHASVLKALGVDVVYVRSPEELEDINALIIPGGESTHMSRMIIRFSLLEALRDFDKPLLGTCAGLIILSKKVLDYSYPTLEKLDITVKRNAYGRQKESFEALVGVGGGEVLGVFIRAPKIIEVGEGVEVIARLNGEVVGVKQGNVIGLTFHPELAGVDLFHRMLLKW